MKKHDVLNAAIAATADRGLNYGKAEDNFDRIARLWNTHMLNRYGIITTIDAADVSMLMILMKVARLENKPDHADSWIDAAGYAACGGEITAPPKARKR
jgi:hypothetical protein